MIAQHSAKSAEHYTPLAIITAAHNTMEGINLDPATTFDVNARRVRASSIFTKETDGLSRQWHGRVWLNPPGGRIGNKSSAALWWAKLADEYASGRVEQAIFLGFTLEILATAQDAALWPGEFPFCVPRRRIEFVQEVAGEFVKGESPPHSNVIVYLPSLTHWGRSVDRFVKHFSQFGKVRQ